jgi:RHS repeat-associated protein
VNGRTGPCYETLGSGGLSPTGPEYPAGADIAAQKFTGKERDAETGLDYFGARYLSSAQGRFSSPDWSSDPDPVPYADLYDPQSLNLYSYVRNNPLNLADRTGHFHQVCGQETIETDKSTGVTTVHANCHDVWDASDFATQLAAVGHHYIPRAIWKGLDKASQSWRFLNKVTTRALKNSKLSNPYDRLHRGVNRQVKELVDDLQKDLGKSVKDFERGDWEKLGERLERAGGDIEKFNARLEELEPEARTMGEAMLDALEEIFPAAVEAAADTGVAAGVVAEGAAETGAIP